MCAGRKNGDRGMKIFYRIRQFFVAIMTRFGELIHPMAISGSKSLLMIGDMLKENGHTKVFVVTIPQFIEGGNLEAFFGRLKEKNIEATVFAEVVSEPTVELVEKALSIYKEKGCQAIVAIGGGSVLDCGKIVGARIARPGKQIKDMKGLLKIRRKLPDLYAVPTTAGTGSETTAAAVIIEEKGTDRLKYAIEDYCLVPKYAVLDPDLTLGLPPYVTASTGMDALTHAVEAYTNKFASKNVKKYALTAINLIFKNLTTAVEKGDDVEARTNMLMASYYAGIAFTNNFVGYVHAIAHNCGAMYRISHGVANAAALPVVLEQYGPKIYKKMGKMAKAAGITVQTDADAAILFIKSIRDMNERYGLPAYLEGLKEEDFDVLIERAIHEGNPTYPVPVIWNKKDFADSLKKLLASK